MSSSSALGSAGSAALPAFVFDFDGTVCVGDGPVRAYADSALGAALAASVLDEAAAAGIRTRLEEYLAGAPDAPAHLDGYAAVAALCADFAGPGMLDAAYAASRAALAAGGLDVAAPAGLAGFLAGLAGRAERVLVTNAPATGVHETLAAIGLDGCFDRIITDAHKPDGWAALLPRLTTDAGRPATRLMSVGDIWLNDLAEPLTAGAATAHVDRFGRRAGIAHVAAPALEELLPALTAWVDDPEAFLAAHPLGFGSTGAAVGAAAAAGAP